MGASALGFIQLRTLQDANGEGDVAFKIMVTSQTYGDRKYDENGVETPRYVDIDVCHDTVSEAIQGAVETAVQEVRPFKLNSASMPCRHIAQCIFHA